MITNLVEIGPLVSEEIFKINYDKGTDTETDV
jgi:hypothetical protein